MSTPNLTITIDGNAVTCQQGLTILQAADGADIYIPRLCHHPDLPAGDDLTWAETIWQGETMLTGEKPGETAGEDAHCNLCLVEVEGQPEPLNSCITPVEDGMVIRTDTPEVIQRRKQALAKILADHPHACYTCAQREGCVRTECSANVPVEERCCVLLGRCELGKVCDYVGIPDYTTKYVPQNRPIIKQDPLFDRDYNLCIGCLRCVRACNDLRGAEVLGAVWKDGRAWVGTLKQDGLLSAECRFCGACVEVCPTGALLDKEDVPAVRRGETLPCVSECPAGIDIPRYLKLIAQGRDQEALDVILSRVPFPSILGYVCFHPCEEICRRGYIDEPVAICAMKRFVADRTDYSLNWSNPGPEITGMKVAVVGSGPAGLTAAYYLRMQGHQMQVFDEADKPGGMLRYAIPDYRLPYEVLDRELKSLEAMGIQFQMNYRLGVKHDIRELKDRDFDAIILALGTSISKTLSIEGTDLDGIHSGLEFLRSAKQNRQPTLDRKVVVIGGGNVAIDAAMTASRLGAGEVHVVCLESRDEMPAHDWEIDQAEAEGIAIHPSWGPIRFLSENRHLAGIELVKCTRVFDDQGRFNPEYDQTVTQQIPADHVIVTIGQEVDQALFDAIPNLEKAPGDLIKVDANFATSIPGVFAVGDVVRGPTSVVEAIADGRRLADAVDRFLGGEGIPDEAPEVEDVDGPRLDTAPDTIQRHRHTEHIADPNQRSSCFDLIEVTIKEEAARQEAQRCLQCHLRQNISPVTLPPEPWLTLDIESVEAIPEAEGVFQLLSGDRKVIRISGTMNLRESLLEYLENPGEAAYFLWEQNPMYTQRESELIQKYLQEHGEMPGGGGGDDDLDDLF
jgi:formate dehydrogenase beta subunit